ncbi:putative E3 ubiquitin-protein ligase LIN-2 isoform X2 [Malania oleifera]|uniref:putative E3 ubiquitin-protein ligase LIN-2 isoform X2 n=1 Tax=Malania oleifera TaxID=397392 RepID=UPI0025AE338B|nr:putative E3 ubiquitin-protein ligase LIN-2 isoform X2 [Malania oleifera]
MSHNFSTPIHSSSSSSLASSHHQERLDLDSIRVVVILINQRILEFLEDAATRNSLKLRCSSYLKTHKQEFFEFSEHSVLSNLYWGIESIEAAIQTEWPAEKAMRLRNSERMLQVSALLDEHGVTAGISNKYLVCCSYFYLSLVWRLQREEWQVALHFLQALLVSPRLVQREFAPGLCDKLFLSGFTSGKQVGRRRHSGSTSSVDFSEDESGEVIRQMARRYKDWLVYYQIMLYGETSWPKCGRISLHSPDNESQISVHGKYRHKKFISSETSNSIEYRHSFQTRYCFEKVYPLDPQKNTTNDTAEEDEAFVRIPDSKDHRKATTSMDQVNSWDIKVSSESKCLQDMLKESQSDATISTSSCDDDSSPDDSEANADDNDSSNITARINIDNLQVEICDRYLYSKMEAPCSCSKPGYRDTSISPAAPGHPQHRESNEVNVFHSSVRHNKSQALPNSHTEGKTTQRRLSPHDFQLVDCTASTSLSNHKFTQMDQQPSDSRKRQSSSSQNKLNEVCLQPAKDAHGELMEIFEKAISKLCFSEGLRKCDEHYTVEVTTIYEMLNNKPGIKYAMLKDVILDQLVTAISTSKEDAVIRTAVSIVTTIVSGNKLVIEEMRKKGLQLCHLACALKRNIHEAAMLIYLANPSPIEIRTLELLPTLVEIVSTSSSYKSTSASLQLTPPAASLMIIEVLVTAFDHATNNIHLAAINSPQVLSGLLNAARNDNLEDFISLANIFVRCMHFDGKCRKHVSQFTPVAPFICILRSNKKRAKFIALEFFHEILRMPRSSSISLLQQMQKEGNGNIMHMLRSYVQQLESEHQLLAANLLLQLDMLENSSSKSTFREEAMEVLLKSVASEKGSASQILSAFILSNIGGTYAWTGEPYTVAWLVKKAGLSSKYCRSMIRNFDWLDQSLQDASIEKWCSKIARSIIKIGNPVFHALEKGLRSKIKMVSRDCLATIAWLGCEIARSPDNLRYSACEILLNGIEQFLHPGFEFEERLLACLCFYNYTSGKGMEKLIHCSEGVKESLRRLSNRTWMAEELLKVADYFTPNKSRISCVHTQILEAGHKCSGSVSALIYYKGELYSGYSDGSIKVWEIKGHSATLVREMKEHKKAVTCFSLFEPGDSLLSGSADKTIRVWQKVQQKLECAEVIETKEPIQNLDTYAQLIFIIFQTNELKVIDASRTSRDICKSKHVKCMRVAQRKIYIGCTDSSIQELAITSNLEQEIKRPSKSWRLQSRPINSIVVYKDWLYSASTTVEGSNLQEWRRHHQPQMSIVTGKRTNVLAMEVVEDFIYLNCSLSTSILQIWLRGTWQKVGRLSAGSRITSLLAANDIILCGTEAGIIKGWIPL